MVDDAPDVMAARLRTAFELFELGAAVRRAQLRRERPDASDEAIEALLLDWIRTRPGAEHGDAWGRAVAWPRPRRSPL